MTTPSISPTVASTAAPQKIKKDKAITVNGKDYSEVSAPIIQFADGHRAVVYDNETNFESITVTIDENAKTKIKGLDMTEESKPGDIICVIGPDNTKKWFRTPDAKEVKKAKALGQKLDYVELSAEEVKQIQVNTEATPIEVDNAAKSLLEAKNDFEQNAQKIIDEAIATTKSIEQAKSSDEAKKMLEQYTPQETAIDAVIAQANIQLGRINASIADPALKKELKAQLETTKQELETSVNKITAQKASIQTEKATADGIIKAKEEQEAAQKAVAEKVAEITTTTTNASDAQKEIQKLFDNIAKKNTDDISLTADVESAEKLSKTAEDAAKKAEDILKIMQETAKNASDITKKEFDIAIAQISDTIKNARNAASITKAISTAITVQNSLNSVNRNEKESKKLLEEINNNPVSEIAIPLANIGHKKNHSEVEKANSKIALESLEQYLKDNNVDLSKDETLKIVKEMLESSQTNFNNIETPLNTTKTMLSKARQVVFTKQSEDILKTLPAQLEKSKKGISTVRIIEENLETEAARNKHNLSQEAFAIATELNVQKKAASKIMQDLDTLAKEEEFSEDSHQVKELKKIKDLVYDIETAAIEARPNVSLKDRLNFIVDKTEADYFANLDELNPSDEKPKNNTPEIGNQILMKQLPTLKIVSAEDKSGAIKLQTLNTDTPIQARNFPKNIKLKTISADNEPQKAEAIANNEPIAIPTIPLQPLKLADANNAETEIDKAKIQFQKSIESYKKDDSLEMENVVVSLYLDYQTKKYNHLSQNAKTLFAYLKKAEEKNKQSTESEDSSIPFLLNSTQENHNARLNTHELLPFLQENKNNEMNQLKNPLELFGLENYKPKTTTDIMLNMMKSSTTKTGLRGLSFNSQTEKDEIEKLNLTTEPSEIRQIYNDRIERKINKSIEDNVSKAFDTLKSAEASAVEKYIEVEEDTETLNKNVDLLGDTANTDVNRKKAYNILAETQHNALAENGTLTVAKFKAAKLAPVEAKVDKNAPLYKEFVQRLDNYANGIDKNKDNVISVEELAESNQIRDALSEKADGKIPVRYLLGDIYKETNAGDDISDATLEFETDENNQPKLKLNFGSNVKPTPENKTTKSELNFGHLANKLAELRQNGKSTNEALAELKIKEKLNDADMTKIENSFACHYALRFASAS